MLEALQRMTQLMMSILNCKAEQFERQKIKFLEDRIKTLETAIESHAKILARLQMIEKTREANYE